MGRAYNAKIKPKHTTKYKYYTGKPILKILGIEKVGQALECKRVSYVRGNHISCDRYTITSINNVIYNKQKEE